MKILVTGGAGFIGHHVALHLLSKGFDVVVLDSFERASPLATRRLKETSITVVKGDVREASLLSSVLRNNVDVVVHCAAYIDVSESFEKPVEYVDNNVAGTVAIAHSCHKYGAKLIHLSSAAVYGNPIQLPIPEEHPLNPISPYGLSKVLSEKVVEFYGKLGLKYTILRPFNVYGPGQTPSYAGVIVKFIERVKKKLPPIIYGDGEQTRDFIHVQDLAEFIELIIEKNVWNKTFNVGTGKPTKIIDLAKTVMKIAGVEGEPVFAPPRPGDIKHSYADISKAKKTLGFKPKISLKEGLRKLIQEHERL